MYSKTMSIKKMCKRWRARCTHDWGYTPYENVWQTIRIPIIDSPGGFRKIMSSANNGSWKISISGRVLATHPATFRLPEIQSCCQAMGRASALDDSGHIGPRHCAESTAETHLDHHGSRQHFFISWYKSESIRSTELRRQDPYLTRQG